jgi:hypothetical protein
MIKLKHERSVFFRILNSEMLIIVIFLFESLSLLEFHNQYNISNPICILNKRGDCTNNNSLHTMQARFRKINNDYTIPHVVASSTNAANQRRYCNRSAISIDR